MECEVFDKGRSPAGRSSRRREGRFEFDHGAQYFTVKSPEFREQVKRWESLGIIAPWDARIVAFETAGVCQEPSPRIRYVGTPGMNSMARAMAEDLQLRCGVQVESIRRTVRGWVLDLVGGDCTQPFDVVFITTPPEQALPFLQESRELTELVQRVTMMPCWAVMIALHKRIESEFDAAFVNQGPLSWVARNNSKPVRPPDECWVLHASPEWSREMLDLDRKDVATELFMAFQVTVGNAELPSVQLAQAHLWRYAQPREPLDDPFYMDRAAGLGVAGDWCGGPKVEGAWLSGQRLAEHLLRF